MKNGAVFAGLIVSESERYIYLEMGNGRIRLEKRKILRRRDTVPPTVTDKKDGKNDAGNKTPGIDQKRDPLAGLRGTENQLDPEIGSKAGNSAASLNDAPLPRGTPEHAVASFLRLIGAGHAQAAVDRWVRVNAILDDFFPAHSKSLTRYSRAKASKSWARILRMVFADPRLMSALRTEGIEVRTVRETGEMSLVEISLPMSPESKAPETYLLSVRNNRIVNFGGMLWPLKKVCDDLSIQLKQAGSWILVPLLEQAANQVMAARRKANGKLGPLILPSVKELRETQPIRKRMPGDEIVRRQARYRITVPPTWKTVSSVTLPKFADIMVQSRSRKAFAMVLVEPSEMVLSALERAARANLRQVSDEVEIHTRRLVTTPSGEAVRFNANAVVLGIPLVYHYHLVSTPANTYQLIAWCHKNEYARFESVLDRVVQSFDIMADDELDALEAPVDPANTPPGTTSTHGTKKGQGSSGKRETTRKPQGAETNNGISLRDRLRKLLGVKPGAKNAAPPDTQEQRPVNDPKPPAPGKKPLRD